MNHSKRVFIVLLLWAFLSACVGKRVHTEGAGTTANTIDVSIDKTFGRYREGLESRQILVTIKAQEHRRLTSSEGRADAQSEMLPVAYQAFLNRLAARYGLERVVDWPIDSIDVYCVIFEMRESGNRQYLIEQLVQDPVIETAQPVNSFNVLQQDYNDPYLSLQHGLQALGAAPVHQWAQGRGVQVAVIDTGLDTGHTEFESRSGISRNFVDEDDQQFRADIHGTAVAGVIAAAADNGAGIVGVAPQVRLMALKACWQTSDDGKRASCNSLTLAKALNYAINQQVDVINLSLAGPPDPLLQRLVSKAIGDNIIVVGARPPHNKPAFPTITPGTVSVSMPVQSRSTVEAKSIVAPGHQVISTRPDNQYGFYTGSSFSTAHIAGLAALMRERSPSLSPRQVLALLQRATDPHTGAVNACMAMRVLDEGVIC